MDSFWGVRSQVLHRDNSDDWPAIDFSKNWLVKLVDLGMGLGDPGQLTFYDD